jgi:Xaa-Pro aminopeptidase
VIDYPARRAKVQAQLRERGVGLLALGPSENMVYLLGFHPHPDERPCLLLMTPERSSFLMPQLNAEESRQHSDLPMHTYADADGPNQALNALAAELGYDSVETVALDETMRTDFSLLLLGRLNGATPILASEVLAPLRARKDAAELELIQRNALIADDAIRAAYAAIEPGRSELEVAQAAREAFAAAGVNGVNFTIVGSGPNGAYPHHHTGARALAEGDAVVIDIGARKDLYNSDITRMAYLGEPSEEYLRVHRIVDDAVNAALAAVRPGAAAREVDGAARRVIDRAGYGQYFVHRTGHGLGLTGHEPPYITSSNDFMLEEGMVFSVEPGIYLPGKFGVRLEEIVQVTRAGARVFSQLPRALHVVQ